MSGIEQNQNIDIKNTLDNTEAGTSLNELQGKTIETVENKEYDIGKEKFGEYCCSIPEKELPPLILTLNNSLDKAQV